MLGNKLKILRENLGLTQKQISIDLKLSEVRYNQYELGKRNPDYSIIKDIANYYKVSIDFLLDNDIKDENKLEREIRKKQALKDLLVEVGYMSEDEELNVKEFIKTVNFAKKIEGIVIDFIKEK